MKKAFVHGLLALALTLAIPLAARADDPPKVGDAAPDFKLKTLEDQEIRLGDLTAKGKVVLVVLRGWPGYQCPICERQVQDFSTMKGKQWPKEFLYVMDPDYTMINAYHLRWNAASETSYPSTFILDKKGIVRFQKVSHSHGDRTTSAGVLEELKKLPAE